MISRVAVFALLAVLICVAQAQTACPDGTLWEPYTEICAAVRDVQSEFLPALRIFSAQHSDAPVPGSMASGTAYAPGQLVAMQSGRLHTRMFVYPNGLERDAPLPAWLYTTATSRVDNGLELLAMYAEDQDAAYLGLFAWSCVPDFPCPDGATSPAWQWSRPMPQLGCNITQVVDQGGHAQKQLYYANHSDRIDNGAPPLWKSAIYLWNYCDAAWDLAWQHLYRQDKSDCSTEDAACAWWGPSIEVFGDADYPHIGELGYEESLLYHDGFWSWLLPPEAQFRDPTNPIWGAQTPWQVFHLEPNRSYGVGNWFNDNDAPVIEGQVELSTNEGQALTIDTSLLTISDADVDPEYHVRYELTVYPGDNYSYSSGTLTPDDGFSGTLFVPVSVNDGAAESPTFDLLISVGPEAGVPVIQGQHPLQTPEDQPVTVAVSDLLVSYPNGNLADLVLNVHAGDFYSYSATSVTPSANFFGILSVPVTVSDGLRESDEYFMSITVVAVNDPPSIDGQRSLQTLERMPVDITTAALVLSDPDNDSWSLTLRVLDGAGYQRVGNTVIPEPGVIGVLPVQLVVSDGELDSDIYALWVEVLADSVPPQIVLNGSSTITVSLGNVYLDAGATAIDNVDGDITQRIVVYNPVNTSLEGTYAITYRVEDLAGNAAAASRTVIVAAAEIIRRSSGGGSLSSLLLLVTALVAGKAICKSFLGMPKRERVDPRRRERHAR